MNAVLLATGIILQAAFVMLYRLPATSTVWTAVLLLTGIAHFAVTLFLLRDSTIFTRRSAVIVFAFAVFFRITLIPFEPVLSDDAYRNVWDGRVQMAGFDPYRFAPESSELTSLRDDRVYPRINHKEYRTIYPPVAQEVALISAMLSRTGIDELIAWKLVLLAIETTGMALLGIALLRRGAFGPFIAYAWSPLAVVEFYGSAHVDAAGAGLLAAALAFLLIEKRARAAGVFAAAVLVKWIALPAAVLFARTEFMNRKRLAGTALLIVCVIFLPYLFSGGAMWESLGSYSGNWEFNGVLHRFLHVDAWCALPRRLIIASGEGFLDPGHPFEKAFGRIALASTIFLGGFMAVRRGVCRYTAALGTLTLFLATQATIHPWYLANLLPLLAVRFHPAILLWLALTPLVYRTTVLYDSTGNWLENTDLQMLAIIPPLLVFAVYGFFVMRLRMRRVVVSEPAAADA